MGENPRGPDGQRTCRLEPPDWSGPVSRCAPSASLALEERRQRLSATAAGDGTLRVSRACSGQRSTTDRDQYADRPQLRPILDAVVKAAQACGPVVIQARKTFVALATERRTDRRWSDPPRLRRVIEKAWPLLEHITSP